MSDSNSVCHVSVTFSLFCVALNVRSFTSVTASTVVVVVEELFAATGSVSVPFTVAVFGIVPVELACTMTLTNCELPTVSVPSVQLIVVGTAGRLFTHVPILGDADMSPRLASNVSVIVTLVAMAGPLLVAVMR